MEPRAYITLSVKTVMNNTVDGTHGIFYIVSQTRDLYKGVVLLRCEISLKVI